MHIYREETKTFADLLHLGTDLVNAVKAGNRWDEAKSSLFVFKLLARRSIEPIEIFVDEKGNVTPINDSDCKLNAIWEYVLGRNLSNLMGSSLYSEVQQIIDNEPDAKQKDFYRKLLQRPFQKIATTTDFISIQRTEIPFIWYDEIPESQTNDGRPNWFPFL